MFKNKGIIRIFSEQQKQRHFATDRSATKEILKGAFGHKENTLRMLKTKEMKSKVKW